MPNQLFINAPATTNIQNNCGCWFDSNVYTNAANLITQGTGLSTSLFSIDNKECWYEYCMNEQTIQSVTPNQTCDITYNSCETEAINNFNAGGNITNNTLTSDQTVNCGVNSGSSSGSSPGTSNVSNIPTSSNKINSSTPITSPTVSTPSYTPNTSNGTSTQPISSSQYTPNTSNGTSTQPTVSNPSYTPNTSNGTSTQPTVSNPSYTPNPSASVTTTKKPFIKSIGFIILISVLAFLVLICLGYFLFKSNKTVSKPSTKPNLK
jgi:hypothetical protein